MPSCLVRPYPWVRIALVVLLTLLVSAWGTCNAMVNFQTCLGVGSTPQISSLSPGEVPDNSESILTVSGTNFTSQTEILWNGNPLLTTFIDSHHLQTTVTRETFASFGGSAGSNVQISVRTPETGRGCPGGTSAALELMIN